MKLLRAQWDRIAAVVAVVIGLIALLLGWIGVSGTAYLAEQMSFVASGGLFGIFALGVGSALWISADLRDEWRKLDGVEQLLAQALERTDPQATVDPDYSSRVVNLSPVAAASEISDGPQGATAVSRSRPSRRVNTAATEP